MNNRTALHLLICVIAVFSQKMVTGQDLRPFRLIGTKTAYNFYDTGWQSYDSTRYTYTGSAIRHQTPSPLENFNGLEGRMPLSINKYTPYYYAGAYPNVSYPIFINLDSVQYDSLIYYGIDYPAEEAWSVSSWNARIYENHLLQQENHGGSAPYLDDYHIFYNAAGSPIEYEISSGYFYPLDPYVKFRFSYADDRLVSYTKEYLPSVLKVKDVEYTLDAGGKPIEELTRLYQQYGSNLSYLHERWNFFYDDKGHVTNMQRWLPDNGTWVHDWEYQFVMDNDLPISLTTLYRAVDTISTPTTLGDWDTVFRTQLYYTGNRVDSVLSEQPENGETSLSSYRREYFSYSGDLLSAYVLLYDIPGIYNDDRNITYSYDTSGRLTAQYITNIFSSNCSQYDSYYHYDEAGNIILIEVHKGASFEQPCDIIATTPQERYYYYYEEVPFAGTSEGDLALNVFPSPATDQFSIQLEALNNRIDDLQVWIFNMQGQEVFNAGISADTAYFTVNCIIWESGVYVVKIQQGNSSAYQKVLVK